VAPPVTKVKISTTDLQQSLMRIARESQKAAKGVEDVVGSGAAKDPNLDVEKRVKSIEQQMRRLTTSGKRMRQAFGGGAGKGAFLTQGRRLVRDIPTTSQGIIGTMLRTGGIIGTAALIIRETANIGISNLKGEAALEQAGLLNVLSSSARLNAMRMGPNNAINNLLKAQEASRVSNTRVRALSFQQRSRSHFEDIKHKLGLTTPESTEEAKRLKAVTDASAAAKYEIGFTSEQITQDKTKALLTPIQRDRALNKLAQKDWTFNVLMALNTTYGFATGKTEAQAHKLGRENAATLFAWTNRDDFEAHMELQAEIREKEIQESHVKLRKSREVIAANHVNDPATGFYIQEARRARDFIHRFHRPRVSGIKRD